MTSEREPGTKVKIIAEEQCRKAQAVAPARHFCFGRAFPFKSSVIDVVEAAAHFFSEVGEILKIPRNFSDYETDIHSYPKGTPCVFF